MATLDELLVRIDASTELLRRELTKGTQSVDRFERRTGRTLGKLDQRFQKFGAGVRRALGSFGIVLGGATITRGLQQATRAAAQYEKTFSEIVGLVGVSREEVDRLSEASKRLATSIGRDPQELAEALFFITSAGARGDQALQILEASAKAAAAGLGETATVADAVTSAVNAYGSANLSAAEATDVLVATVREGKAAADTIAGSLGRVIPIAAELGVEFSDVGATLATLTRIGSSAEEGATALTAVLNGLLKPGQKAQETLEKAGLSAATLRQTIRERGLLAALFELREALGDDEEALTRVFENVRALRGVLGLVGKNAAATQGIFDSLSDSTGSLDAAFAAASETAQNKFDRALAEIKVSAIDLGEVALPGLAKAFGLFAGAVSSSIEILESFGDELGFIAESIERGFSRTFGGRLFAQIREGLASLSEDTDISKPVRELRDEIEQIDDEVADSYARLRALAEAPDPVGSVAIQARQDAVREVLAKINELLVKRKQLLQDIIELETQEQQTQGPPEPRATPGAVADPRLKLLELIEPEKIIERATAKGAARGQAIRVVRDIGDEMKFIADDVENKWEKLGGSLGFTLRNALSDAFLGIERDWGDLLRKMAADFLANQVLSGLSSVIPINNPIGAFFSGITSRASGGPLLAGQPALVGERGPELFVPNIAGSVLNSKQLSGLGVTLHQVNNIDARGADPAVLGRLGPVLEQNRRQTVAEVKHLLDRRRL